MSTALAIHTSSANQRLLNLRSTLQVLTKNDQLLVVFLSTILLYTIYGLIMGGYFSLFIEKQQLFSPSIYAIIVTGLLTHLGAISSFELLVRRTSRSAVFNISLLLMLLGFILILFSKLLLDSLTLIDQFLISASPNLGTSSIVCCCIFHKNHVRRNR